MNSVHKQDPPPLTIFTRIYFSTSQFPEVSPDTPFASVAKGLGNLRESSEESQIYHAFKTEDDNTVAPKTRYYAEAGNSIEEILNSQKIDTVILFGIRTSGVILATALRLFDLDYNMYIISNNTIEPSPLAESIQHSILYDIFPKIPVRVITIKEALEGLLDTQGHAVADIIAMIEILSDPANRAPLEVERALAEDWYRRSQRDNEPEVNERPSVPDTPQPPFVMPNAYCWGWRAEQAQLLPELLWPDDGLTEFPFITTCLLLGLLRDDRDGDTNTTNSNSVRPGDVQLQPLSTIFRGDCKEYGLVILDISDLDNGVKYGIVAFDVHYMADVFCHGPDFDWNPNIDPPPEKEPDTVLHSLRPREPLSIVEWLRENYFSRAKDPRILRLKKISLVHRSVLNYIWPRELENQAKKSPQGVISSISDCLLLAPKAHYPRQIYIPTRPGLDHLGRAAGKEHRDQAIDNLLILTQDPADLHLDQNTIENFQKLAEFREQVRKRLEDVPDSLGPSKLSSHILRVAYAGRMHLNWVAFRNLSPSVIAAAVASNELRGASALSLCVDNFKLEGDEGGLSDLEAALSQSTGLKQLCFLQGPDRDSDNASAHFWTQLQQRWRSSGDLGWLRDKTIYLTCAFSSSLYSSKLSSPLPTTVSLTSPVVQAFPVMHMFTFVDDADPRFQKHQNSSSSSYYDDMSNTLLITERSAFRLSIIPPFRGFGLRQGCLAIRLRGGLLVTHHYHHHHRRRRQFTAAIVILRTVRYPGSWVILVDQRSRNLSDGDGSLLRYAFIRIGRTSSETASEKQQHRPSSVLLEVIGGLTEFLRGAVPGINLFMWEKRVEEVEKNLRARTLTETGKRCMGIGVMDESSTLTLLDQIRDTRMLTAQGSPPGKSHKNTLPRSSRPRADQFCVYNKGPDGKAPAFIIEYKAPHKLSLAHIKAGLQPMDLDEVLRLQKEETPESTCRRTIAAVITQAFSYMIHGGLEYGYVCTSEAFIFLRVLDNDASTIHYYLSVPEEDFGPTTGWTGRPNSDNRLHLTALGQVLAFTLRALRVPTRDLAWTTWAARGLDTWVMVYDDLLDEISEKDIPSSDFKPPTRSRNEYCRATPVKTRSKSTAIASCNSLQNPRPPDDDAGDGFNPDTPSRRPRELSFPNPSSSSSGTGEASQRFHSKGKSRQYCTQLCLLVLVKGGEFDRTCPNVLDHGTGRHELNRITLIHRLSRQLSNNSLHRDSQLGCESLHIHGTRGALFKITLWSHGYVFVGKGVPAEFVKGSKHEKLIYSRLSPIQGTSVPVLLGSLRLSRPFSYDGIAEIVHLTLMGYAGGTLASQQGLDRCGIVSQAEKSLQAIHNLGVLHSDPIPGNMVWNQKLGQVMFIDFERASLQTRRVPLDLTN
ncbi:uncharacterized protein KD926_003226 [Aspergillus affinis]|uniref:uncharacterized protein n=1 Tax=Aspergillus affinis TaxID=1070780 RepID=UPI0022FDE231|nr:uncharacterized protein KD926_003226 [Aspergillus affinis]KAI9035566.1 hypothetical protein KD926_003226 [Aspergillus affinis]